MEVRENTEISIYPMKTPLYNLQLDILNTEETLDKCQSYLASGRNNRIFFVNAHCFNMAQRDSTYRNCLHDAELVLNDGIGMKVAAHLSNISFKENMNGTDLIPKILKLSSELGIKVFLLGGKPGIVDKAKENLEKKIPGIQIAGTHHGYFSPSEEPEVIRQINASDAQVLVVGMGVPLQELWINKHQSSFPQMRITVAGGAIFDFEAQSVKRAPLWIQKSGLEWLFRLIQEPKRLYKRYINGGFEFAFRLFQLMARPTQMS